MPVEVHVRVRGPTAGESARGEAFVATFADVGRGATEIAMPRGQGDDGADAVTTFGPFAAVHGQQASHRDIFEHVVQARVASVVHNGGHFAAVFFGARGAGTTAAVVGPAADIRSDSAGADASVAVLPLVAEHLFAPGVLPTGVFVHLRAVGIAHEKLYDLLDGGLPLKQRTVPSTTPGAVDALLYLPFETNSNTRGGGRWPGARTVLSEMRAASDVAEAVRVATLNARCIGLTFSAVVWEMELVTQELLDARAATAAAYAEAMPLRTARGALATAAASSGAEEGAKSAELQAATRAVEEAEQVIDRCRAAEADILSSAPRGVGGSVAIVDGPTVLEPDTAPATTGAPPRPPPEGATTNRNAPVKSFAACVRGVRECTALEEKHPGKKARVHIPYRDARISLTLRRYMVPSCDDSAMAVVACVAPIVAHSDFTHTTLALACRMLN